MKRHMIAIMLSLGLCSTATAAQSEDPLNSPMWDYMRQIFIGDAPYQFDDKIVVEVPAFAEDPTQAPVSVDATAYSGEIVKIVAWADLNPIQHIFTYYPHPDVVPRVSLRIKVQQGTAVRAAVLTKDGSWHVGGQYLDAAGGGCTAPSMGNANPYWESHLGEMKTKLFARGEQGRYKLKVIHPMDTGLADGIPEFYIQQVVLRNSDGGDMARLELSQPVSENPVISFDVRDSDSKHIIWMRDNGGNEFEQTL
ncbi:quinoprotein dehydrogenase-associated SoxYZ-like carrier [Pontibacter sp. JAM-7]|uniref:quinoprotein dehydrogenase-associated SoxYZ-like carrier n=1 Tax=Pontibacter sp. JAM-7 TaxID=3366581 RepID=UPI003AF6513A